MDTICNDCIRMFQAKPPLSSQLALEATPLNSTNPSEGSQDALEATPLNSANPSDIHNAVLHKRPNADMYDDNRQDLPARKRPNPGGEPDELCLSLFYGLYLDVLFFPFIYFLHRDYAERQSKTFSTNRHYSRVYDD